MQAATQVPEAECDFAVLEQAAEWFAVLSADDVSDQERAQWQLWLAESSQHALAWQRVEIISHHFQRIPSGQRHGARQALQGKGQTRRQTLKLMTLLCSAGVLAWSASSAFSWKQWYASYQTRVGEIKDFQLADGSHLCLNTDTAMDVSNEPDRLHLVLYKGEVLVSSTDRNKDSSYPLVLDTAYGALLARDTQFSIYDRGSIGELTVFKGSVQLAPVASASVTIKAGQQVRFTADAISAAQAIEQRRKAWVKGTLLADNMRLGDFVDELARYRTGHLACDPKVADLRIVGAYPLKDTDRVLAALEQSLPVSIRRPLPWWTSISARPA
ncbi:FecR domain-containing protein [Pseudomonas asuensis]|uniref:Membrane protein n=1 Tax=Pseudomonas asuensis TaxID=1825787 RepID=A0ABQ2H292_9PSED|nr:FecR domain-containing protein [Pseudomonas asuensis]GGM22359.1 membrane protein [Pseudomonas asuensis]